METKLPQFYETEIIRNEKFSDDVALIEAKLPENANLSFKAGQFALIYVTVNGKEINRAFSFCSKPAQKTVEFLIKKYDQGSVTPLLFNLKKRDKLKIRGPFGVFNVRKPIQEETVFITAGTGVAPFRSMINEILEGSPEAKIILIYGFRKEGEYFFNKEFENLKKKHPNFHIHLCCTQPSENWQHRKGRVTKFLKEILKVPENKHAYICGPNPMINDSLNILIKEIGFKKEQTNIERWG